MKDKDQLEILPFWQLLSDHERHLLKAGSYDRKYRKGELIMDQVNEYLGLIIVQSGEVRIYTVSEDGREITLFILCKGDYCVLTDAMLGQLTIEVMLSVVQNTVLSIIPSDIFDKVMADNIDVRCFLYEMGLKKMSHVVNVMGNILFSSFDKRLASYLVSEHERTGSLVINATHEQIAIQVNSAREVVARMLKQFVHKGLIRTSRGQIHIIDLKGLKNIMTL